MTTAVPEHVIRGARANPGRALRIAVDGRVIQDRYEGIGRQTFELVRTVSERENVELDVLCGDSQPTRLSADRLADFANVRLHEFDVEPVSFRQQLRWPRMLQRIKPDVLLVPYHLSVPFFSSCPVVTVVHDCIFEENAAWAPSETTRRIYIQVTKLALRRATSIVTVSEATRSALGTHYAIEIPPENVVPNGVDERFRRPVTAELAERAKRELHLPDRYVFHIGVRRPHKNHATLVRAFAEIAEAEPDVDLVLVGRTDPRFHDVVPSLVSELGLERRVHCLPSVEEELLPAVYQSASVFAFPSAVEGFGLPIAEAMAARVPVVASDAVAVQEAAGKAAVIAPTFDVAIWATALRSVLDDAGLAERLRTAGSAVAAGRTWTTAADRLFPVLVRSARQ